jgi:hypothetical protein
MTDVELLVDNVSPEMTLMSLPVLEIGSGVRSAVTTRSGSVCEADCAFAAPQNGDSTRQAAVPAA